MTFDVSARLAEGQSAVSTFQTYLLACQCLGHQFPAAFLDEQYNSELGLDLSALDADARSMAAAARTAQEAMLVQHHGARSITADWSGFGGGAALSFLAQHVAGARSAVMQLGRSAQAVATLRDELSHAVDAKVDAVLQADQQSAGQRAAWTAAARAVLGGAGGLAAASEVVDQQVLPFVDQVILGQVLPALRAASDAVVAAYDSALAAVTPEPVVFGSPGSPVLPPIPVTPTVAEAPPSRAPTVPAAAPTAAPAGMPPEPVAGPPAAPTPPPMAPAPPPAPPAGMPDLGFGSTMGGLGQQLSDVLGGVLGSVGGLVSGKSGLGADGIGGFDALDEQLDSDNSGESDDKTGDLDDEKGDDEKGDDEKGDDEKGDDEEDKDAESSPEGDESVAEPGAPASEKPPATPAPEPVAETLPVDPVVTAQPTWDAAAQEPPAAKTPCEIAADQLPQVGE